jgi:predicted phosphoadenosine phosphosulfate sulfurtransferase
MREKINSYIESWLAKGYPSGIPDEVPLPLMRLNLAPSYQAICLAILRNDTSLQSIGYTPPKSPHYYALKAMRFSLENGKSVGDVEPEQLTLFPPIP